MQEISRDGRAPIDQLLRVDVFINEAARWRRAALPFAPTEGAASGESGASARSRTEVKIHGGSERGQRRPVAAGAPLGEERSKRLTGFFDAR